MSVSRYHDIEWIATHLLSCFRGRLKEQLMHQREFILSMHLGSKPTGCSENNFPCQIAMKYDWKKLPNAHICSIAGFALLMHETLVALRHSTIRRSDEDEDGVHPLYIIRLSSRWLHQTTSARQASLSWNNLTIYFTVYAFLLFLIQDLVAFSLFPILTSVFGAACDFYSAGYRKLGL